MGVLLDKGVWVGKSFTTGLAAGASGARGLEERYCPGAGVWRGKMFALGGVGEEAGSEVVMMLGIGGRAGVVVGNGVDDRFSFSSVDSGSAFSTSFVSTFSSRISPVDNI